MAPADRARATDGVVPASAIDETSAAVVIDYIDSDRDALRATTIPAAEAEALRPKESAPPPPLSIGLPTAPPRPALHVVTSKSAGAAAATARPKSADLAPLPPPAPDACYADTVPPSPRVRSLTAGSLVVDPTFSRGRALAERAAPRGTVRAASTEIRANRAVHEQQPHRLRPRPRRPSRTRGHPPAPRRRPRAPATECRCQRRRPEIQ